MNTVAKESCDVVIAGAGNAGLTAALSAHEAGAKVLVLEKAPKGERGGNTYLSGGGMRLTFKGIDEVKELTHLTEEQYNSYGITEYSADEFYSHLMRATKGRMDPHLAETLVTESNPTTWWLARLGVKIEARTRVAARIGDKVRWDAGHNPLGVASGAQLSDALFQIVEKKGIELRYGTRATKLLVDAAGKICGVTIKDNAGYRDVKCKGVVLACAGFEANREMRVKYMGPAWEMAPLRCSRYNTGDGLRMALEIGADTAGHFTTCHGNAMDANAPEIADRSIIDKLNRQSVRLGIMVNIEGKRFVDEGEASHTLGEDRAVRTILAQPERLAYQIFDSKGKGMLQSDYANGMCTTANSIEELAGKLDIDKEAFIRTVKEFNAAVQPGEWDLTREDGKGTRGITPPKTNWALEIDKPPFYAYPVTMGITFPFGGLKIDSQARVLDIAGEPIPGLYAAGEIVGMFYYDYLGGAALMAGAVFGRIAGAKSAAR